MNSRTMASARPAVPAQIYTTGAYLSPVKCFVDGREQWFWKVDEFSDDSYQLGEEFNPLENSKTLSGLMPVNK